MRLGIVPIRSSLARTLTIWYAASLALILTSASVFCYQSLKSSLDLEDQTIVNDRIQTIFSLLVDPVDPVGKVKARVESEWASRHFEKIYVHITDDTGKTAAETPAIPTWVRNLTARSEYLKPYSTSRQVPIRVTPPPVSPLLILAMEGTPHGSARRWSVFVAMDLGAQSAVLTAYKLRLICTLLVAFFASIFIGRFIAARGLRPVRIMAEALSKINSRDLSQRLPTDLPVELEILGRTFNELLERIESTLNKLSRFSADMAHEIRTPISNLRGEIEVALSRCRTPSEYQEVLSSNLEECVRLKSIVDSLLFLARAESANPNLKRKELRLREELANIAEFYEASAADADVELRIDVPEMLTLRADHVLFQTAIGNLLSNAIRYTPKGGNITISALRQSSNVVAVKIADTGIGIPAEHLPFVFDRLYRVDQQRSSSGKENFGLGLSIVEAILRIHGGNASIESCVDKGTVVNLRFPADTGPSA